MIIIEITVSATIFSTDHYVADLIATLGTADIVLGSVDKIFISCLLQHFYSNELSQLDFVSISTTVTFHFKSFGALTIVQV